MLSNKNSSSDYNFPTKSLGSKQKYHVDNFSKITHIGLNSSSTIFRKKNRTILLEIYYDLMKKYFMSSLISLYL